MSKIPWCSVIIPTLNEAATLAATLTRLQERPRTITYEIIVADGGSTDGSAAIARRHGARTLTAPRGRARQMNAGAAAARGQTLYFLHADTLVPKNWLEILYAGTPSLPRCFRLRFDDDRNRWLRLFAYLSRLDVDAFRFGDQSLWVTKSDFQACGGYADDLLLLEDNDLIVRLKRHLGGLEILEQSVVTSARKYHRNGVLYTQAVYVTMYTLYRLGLSQQRLAAIYRRLLA